LILKINAATNHNYLQVSDQEAKMILYRSMANSYREFLRAKLESATYRNMRDALLTIYYAELNTQKITQVNFNQSPGNFQENSSRQNFAKRDKKEKKNRDNSKQDKPERNSRNDGQRGKGRGKNDKPTSFSDDLRKNNYQNDAQFTCEFCNAVGHQKAKCFKLIRQQQKEKDKAAKGVNTTTGTSTSTANTQSQPKAPPPAPTQPAQPTTQRRVNHMTVHNDVIVTSYEQHEILKEEAIKSVNSVEASTPKTKTLEILIDSGAEFHVTDDLSILSNVNDSRNDTWIQGINKNREKVLAAGTLTFYTKDNANQTHKHQLNDVLYVPKTGKTLLCTSKYHKENRHELHLKDSKLKYYEDGKPTETFTMFTEKADIPYLEIIIELEKRTTKKMTAPKIAYVQVYTTTRTEEPVNQLELWHQRLGHIDRKKIVKMVKNASVLGLNIDDLQISKIICKSCLVGKMRNKKFEQATHPPKGPLEIVHSDIAGPVTTSWEGFQYLINFIDSFSKLNLTYAMKHKSQAKEKLLQYLAETSLVGKMKILRTDQGTEYKSMKYYLRDLGINWQHTHVNTPQSNSDSEVRWKILFGMMRAMLYFCGLSVRYWPYAMSYGTIILNWTLTDSQRLLPITPHELFYGYKPDLSMIKTFGCQVIVWNNARKRQKFDDRATSGIFLGLSTKTKGVIVLLENGEITTSRNVQFLENIPIQVPSGNITSEEEGRRHAEKAPTEKLQAPKSLPLQSQDSVDVRIPSKHHSKNAGTESMHKHHSSDTQETENSQEAESTSSVDTDTELFPEEPPKKELKESDGEESEDDNQPPINPRFTYPSLPSSSSKDSDHQPSIESEHDNPIDEPDDNQQSFTSATPKSDMSQHATTPQSTKQTPEKVASSPLYNSDDSIETKRELDRQNARRNWKDPTSWPPPFIYADQVDSSDGLSDEEHQLTEESESENYQTDEDDDSDYHHISTATQSIYQEVEPTNVKEALKDSNWYRSMREELQSLEQNMTYNEVLLPKGERPTSTKWVWRIKRNMNGNIEKYKSRLVARGFNQIYGHNYWFTFSPVTKAQTMKILISIYALIMDQEGILLDQYDAKNAYLHGKIDVDIYLSPPPGFEKFHQNGEKLFWKLNKSLYGLKQAGRIWYNLLTDALLEAGFTRSNVDLCFFYLFKGSYFILLAVHVDDATSLCNSKQLRDEIMKPLQEKLQFSLTGPATFILATEIIRDMKNKTVTISQRKYILELLGKYNMLFGKIVKTPIEKNSLLDKQPFSDQRKYQEMVGSLTYLAATSRPDIAYAVSKAASYNSKPTEGAWVLTKRILRYLLGTTNLAIMYQNTGNHAVFGYADADYAGNDDNRRSTSGSIFLLANAPIAWSSKRQPTTTLSTAEAEFIALGSAVSEAVFLRNLITDAYKAMGKIMLLKNPTLIKGFTETRIKEIQEKVEEEFKKPTKIFQDNQAAILLATNNTGSKRIKHADIKFYFIRDMVSMKIITLEYTKSENMAADFLTKPVSAEILERNIKAIGMRYYIPSYNPSDQEKLKAQQQRQQASHKQAEHQASRKATTTVPQEEGNRTAQL
jgi:transposase InsO family protein